MTPTPTPQSALTMYTILYYGPGHLPCDEPSASIAHADSLAAAHELFHHTMKVYYGEQATIRICWTSTAPTVQQALDEYYAEADDPMTYWCHRVLRDADGNLFLAEVHYEDYSETNTPEKGIQFIGYTDASLVGADLEELKTDLARMQRALEMRIIDVSEFPANPAI